MSARDATSPETIPAMAPPRENRRHESESRMTGTLALAATANAKPTRNATLNPRSAIESAIDSAPTTTAVARATKSGSVSSPLPLRMRLNQMSCANADEAVMVISGRRLRES